MLTARIAFPVLFLCCGVLGIPLPENLGVRSSNRLSIGSSVVNNERNQSTAHSLVSLNTLPSAEDFIKHTKSLLESRKRIAESSRKQSESEDRRRRDRVLRLNYQEQSVKTAQAQGRARAAAEERKRRAELLRKRVSELEQKRKKKEREALIARQQLAHAQQLSRIQHAVVLNWTNTKAKRHEFLWHSRHLDKSCRRWHPLWYCIVAAMKKAHAQGQTIHSPLRPREPRHSLSWKRGIPLCGTVSVTHGSPIVRTTCDLRAEIASGEYIKIGNDTLTVTEPRDQFTLSTTLAYAGPTQTGMRTVKVALPPPSSGDEEQVCGTVTVVNGSRIVRTSCDLRRDIPTGDTIRIDQDMYTVLPPRDSRTLTLDRPWDLADANHTAFHLSIPWRSGLLPLSGLVTVQRSQRIVFTTRDLTSELQPGDTVRIRAQQFSVVAPITDRSFLVDVPVDGQSASQLKAFRLSRSTRLEGTVCLAKGSVAVNSTADLSTTLALGDTLSLGSTTVTVGAPVNGLHITLSKPWSQLSLCGVPAYKIIPSLPHGAVALPGTVTATQHSYHVATSTDLRKFLSVSDPIYIGNRIFAVLEPFDFDFFTISSPYPDPTTITTAYRLPRTPLQRTAETLAAEKLACDTLFCMARVEEKERDLLFTAPKVIPVHELLGIDRAQALSPLLGGSVAANGVVSGGTKATVPELADQTLPDGSKLHLLRSNEAMPDAPSTVTSSADSGDPDTAETADTPDAAETPAPPSALYKSMEK